jgi:two-component system nitrogen regulation sensor histidine kinase NtrY
MFICTFVAFRLSIEKSVDFNKLQTKIATLDKDLKETAVKLMAKKPDFYNPVKTPYFIHYYKGDSLVYWNTNKIPVSKYTSLQFPSQDINRLQNGWYLSKICQRDGEKLAVSYQLKNEFDYENAFLENRTNDELSETPFIISLNQNEGKQIKSYTGKYLFSVISPPKKNNENPWILVFLCFGLVALFFGIHERISVNSARVVSLLLMLFLIRLIIFFFDFQYFFENQQFASAELFGYNEIFSTFFEFSLNVIIGSAIFLLISDLLKGIKNGTYFLLVWLFVGWWLIAELIRMVVFNSAIPLNLLDFFDLTIFSFLTLVLVGLALYTIYRTQKLILQNRETLFFYIQLFSSLAFSVLLVNTEKCSLLTSLFPMVSFITWRILEKINGSRFSKNFILLIVFSIPPVADFNRNQILKEQENRKLFAHQTAIEQDINLELAYAKVKEKLKKDPLIQSVATGEANGISVSDFGDILEKKYFKGIWNVYEQNFNLCDSSGKSIFTGDSQFFQLCQTHIDKAGKPSVLDSNLFYIPNSMVGYTYIIREIIKVRNTNYFFLVTLKSKRIPEEIGFPRLLISKNASVLKSLEHYSIGKYAGKRLTRSFGSFHFPTSLNAFPKSTKQEHFINYNGYNHYLLKNGNQTIILSIKNYEFVDYVSAFAVVFCFFGLNLFIIILLQKKLSFQYSNSSLARKIQYSSLVLIVFVLLIFATGSGYYFQKQLQQSSNEIIEDKLISIEEELRGKISLFKNLNIESHGSLLESILMKLARVFKTDLNVYDKSGFLIASSRSKVFNQGLLSEQINPEAFGKIMRDKSSFFMQKENIGKLNYVSSYQPIYNGEQKLLGYINLQHFGQQQAFEEQLKTFIIAVVNVFIILLLLSIGIALIVSNWVTLPLKLLQKRVAGLEITSDIKIEYSGRDEIGTIVSAYNLKLEQLKTAAKKLAQTERETAWREMAQQVAHEIKNPLTPMKLNIQQLLRVYDPTDQNSTEKVKRVLNSIMEQIDGMTRIANEFSRFAKMPEPIKKEVDLIALIENTVSFFEAEENIKFNLVSAEKELILLLDKEQWVQVFNNLIQNAIHAIEGMKNGEIIISIRKDHHFVLIDVSDNGCGIKAEEQEKIFVPYFTTKNSGSGIGLSMIKQIIENHEGEISFVSKIGKGTSFSIKLRRFFS